MEIDKGVLLWLLSEISRNYHFKVHITLFPALHQVQVALIFSSFPIAVQTCQPILPLTFNMIKMNFFVITFQCKNDHSYFINSLAVITHLHISSDNCLFS